MSKLTEVYLRDLYFIKNLTIEQIARQENVSTWSISSRFKKYNIKVKKLNNPYGSNGKGG